MLAWEDGISKPNEFYRSLQRSRATNFVGTPTAHSPQTRVLAWPPLAPPHSRLHSPAEHIPFSFENVYRTPLPTLSTCTATPPFGDPPFCSLRRPISQLSCFYLHNTALRAIEIALPYVLAHADPSLPLQTAKKTVLITGANKGIGKESVRQLATQGFQVFLGARDEVRGQAAVDEIRASGLKDVHLLVIDVTSDDSVKKAFETLSTKISALDVLVNNAGVAEAGLKLPLEESITEVIATYEVNVFGLIRVTNAFIPLLKKSLSGHVINVSSALGSLELLSNPTSPYYGFNCLGYNSSKSAVNQITISYAKALKEFKIRVNATHPGYVDTDLSRNKGTLTVQEGAKTTVELALQGADGPTGTFTDKDGTLAW